MEPNFWHQRWTQGEIAFHQEDFHPQLVKYIELFPAGKVMVPLCGKSFDLIYLALKKHRVVGVELSPIACEAFFNENNIKFEKSPRGDFMVFESEWITLWCGDFMSLPAEAWKDVTGIYDRAALVALPEPMRQHYAASIAQNIEKLGHVELLLISVEYPLGSVVGPPFSISKTEIQNLYGSSFDIQKLFYADDPEFFRNHPKFKQTKGITESVFWMKKKGVRFITVD